MKSCIKVGFYGILASCLLSASTAIGQSPQSLNSSKESVPLQKEALSYDHSLKATHFQQANPSIATDVHDFYVPLKWANTHPLTALTAVSPTQEQSYANGSGGVEKFAVKKDSLILDSIDIYVASVVDWEPHFLPSFKKFYISIYKGLPGQGTLVYGPGLELNENSTVTVDSMGFRYITYPTDGSSETVDFYPSTMDGNAIINDVYRVRTKLPSLKLPRGEYYLCITANVSKNVKLLAYTPADTTYGTASSLFYTTGENASTDISPLYSYTGSSAAEDIRAFFAIQMHGFLYGDALLQNDASVKASIEQDCDMTKAKVWVTLENNGKKAITTTTDCKIEYAIDTAYFEGYDEKWHIGEFVEGALVLPDYKTANCEGNTLGQAILGTDSTVNDAKVCGFNSSTYLLYPKSGNSADLVNFGKHPSARQRLHVRVSLDGDQWEFNDKTTIEFVQSGKDLTIAPTDGAEVPHYSWSMFSGATSSWSVEPLYTTENGGWQTKDSITILQWGSPFVATQAVTWRPGTASKKDQVLNIECLTFKENQSYAISAKHTTFGKHISLEIGYTNALENTDTRVILDTVELYSPSDAYNDADFVKLSSVTLPGGTLKLYLKYIELDQAQRGTFMIGSFKVEESTDYDIVLSMGEIPASECAIREGIFKFQMQNKGSKVFNDSIRFSFDYNIDEATPANKFSYATKANLGDKTTTNYVTVEVPFSFAANGTYSIAKPEVQVKIDNKWTAAKVDWDYNLDAVSNVISVQGPTKNRYSTNFEKRADRNSWICMNSGAEANGIGQWLEAPLEAKEHLGSLSLPDEGHNSRFAISGVAGQSGATWVHSPCIDLNTDSLYKISYFTKYLVGAPGNKTSLRLSYILTTGNRSDLEAAIFHSEVISKDATYTAKKAYMHVPANETYYVGIMLSGGSNGTTGYVDDFELAPVPLMPITNLIANNATTSSVSLSWNAPTGGELIPNKYIIRVNGLDVATIDSTALTYTATKLNSNTEYTFDVVAAYLYMTKSAAVSVKDTTLEVFEAQKPLDVAISKIDSTSAVLTWRAPVKVPDNYVVYLDGAAKDTVNGTTYTFTGLSPKTDYIAGVAARSHGMQSETVSIDFRTLEVLSIEIAKGIKLNVWPNPSKYGIFNIESSLEGKAILFDQAGRRLEEFNILNGTTTISLGSRMDGIYYLQLSTSSGSKTLKLIK